MHRTSNRQLRQTSRLLFACPLLLVLFCALPILSAPPPDFSLTAIPQSNGRAAFDTASLFVRHASTFLETRIPAEWGFTPNGLDSTSRFDWAHVGAIYLQGGFRGFNRWLVGTPIDITEHEDPAVRVSNDGIHWSVFTDGVHTCRDPLFTRDSCRYRGQIAAYLSDTDILMGKDGKIWIIWRATCDSNDSTFHSLWVSSTADGYTWSAATKILGWWAETTQGTRLSPAWWIDQYGNYRMWVVQADRENPDSNIIELWKSPRPDYSWQLIDTVRRTGSNTPWMGIGDMKVGGAWHPEVVDYSEGKKIVILVNAYRGAPAYRSLYVGVTPDDGYSLDMRYEPLLTPTDTLATAQSNPSWDSRVLYRSTAYWVTEGEDSLLEMIYIGASPALPGTGGLVGSHWRMGRTCIDRADKIQLRVADLNLHPGDIAMLPVQLTNPQDTIASFSLTIAVDRPDLVRIDSFVQTAGTLTEGWSISTMPTISSGKPALRIAASTLNPIGFANGMIAPSDLSQTLLKVRLSALHVDDTLTDRRGNLAIDRNLLATAFSHPFGDTLATMFTIHADTNCWHCAQWDSTGCVQWEPATYPDCDSTVILFDTTVGYDEGTAYFKDGSVTILECSSIPSIGDINGDGSSFTPNDRTALQTYLATRSPVPSELRNADIDGDCMVGWADLQYFDQYVAGGPDSIWLPTCSCPLPVWNCCFGSRGNITNDYAQTVDLSDLSLLIAFLTTHAALACSAEANMVGSQSIDLSDLSFLISYLTVTPRPPLPPCQ